MDSCDAYEPLLTEALFGELSREERARLDAHLSECDGCRQTLEASRQTLDLMDRRERPAPPDGFWASFDRRLDDALAEEPAAAGGKASSSHRERGATSSWTLPSGVYDLLAGVRAVTGPWTRRGALALLLVAFGVFLGRTLFAPAPPPSAPAFQAEAQGAQPGALARRTRLCLARSKALLLEMQTVDASQATPEALDVPGKKSSARSLAAEARALDSALEAPEQERLHTLLTELRGVLLQIADLKDQSGFDDLDRINVQVNDSQLVLRINLEELRLSSLLAPDGFDDRLSLDFTPSTTQPNDPI